MGSSPSAHKSSESAVGVKWSIESKTGDVSSRSLAKDNAVGIECPVAETGFRPQSSSILPVSSFVDSNNKEELFFDSQPWLDSDCEDFFSVNGDLTPSLGNTPLHQSSLLETPKLEKLLYTDRTHNSMSGLSPSNQKKKLIELFRESFGSDSVDRDKKSKDDRSIISPGKPEAKLKICGFPSKSVNGSPNTSVANFICCSETTPNSGVKPEKEKLAGPVQCCLPNMIRSLSFSERKRRPRHSYSGEG